MKLDPAVDRTTESPQAGSRNAFVLLLKTRQFTLLSLVVLTTLASLVFGFLHFKHEQANLQRAINRATFYDRVVHERATATGPPLAKVAAIDNSEPVAGVIIGMTLIGPDGGDGGFQCYLTQETGVACLHQPLIPGRYQYHLVPGPKSRFVPTQWHQGQPYIVIANDGTSTVPTLKLNVGNGG